MKNWKDKSLFCIVIVLMTLLSTSLSYASTEKNYKSSQLLSLGFRLRHISFNKLIKSEEYTVYMKIKGQMIPIKLIYADYESDSGIAYQEVICTNFLTAV